MAGFIGLTLLATIGVLVTNSIRRTNEAATECALLEQRIDESLTSAEDWYRRNEFAPAVEAVKRAENLVQHRDDALARRVRQRVLDIETAQRLNHIRLESAVDREYRGGEKQNKYLAVFKDYGLPMSAVSDASGHRPHEFAKSIRESFIQNDLIAAIYDFAEIALTNIVENPTAKSMLDAARFAEPDPWRDGLFLVLTGAGRARA